MTQMLSALCECLHCVGIACTQHAWQLRAHEARRWRPHRSPAKDVAFMRDEGLRNAVTDA